MRTQTIATDGPAEGRRRRNRALAGLESHFAALIARAERALLAALLRSGTATIDDVRDELGDVPGGTRPHWLGAVPRGLASVGIIERVGFQSSVRAVSHARPVSVWRLIDRPAAEARLRGKFAAVPEEPEPALQRRLWEG